MRAAFSPPPRQPAVDPTLKQSPIHQQELNQSLRTSTDHSTSTYVSPSLLNAIDSSTAAEVQQQSGIPGPSMSSSTATGSAIGSTPTPITPDQVPLKEPQYSSSAGTAAGESSSARSFNLSADDSSQRRRRSRQSRDGRGNSDRRSGSRRGDQQDMGLGNSTMGSDDLEKIGGQDSLEVRQVNLGNGQVASLILEEGRLQRIVSSNGQIAELQWQPPPATVRDQKVSKPQLAVKMHRGVSPPQKQGSSLAIPLPVTVKRWANSLNSQRLTAHSDYGGDIFTAPVKTGPKAKSSADIGTVKSVDFSARRRPARNSLLSAPTGKAASHGDMNTIMESKREVKGNWNPMHESWLPQNMTAQQAATERSSREGSRKELHKRRQSADSGLVFNNAPLQPRQETGPIFASQPAAPVAEEAQATEEIQGEAGQRQGKPGLWRSIKRILSFPTVSKSHQPVSPAPSVAPSKRSVRERFNLSGTTKKPEPAAAPARPESGPRRNKSMSSSRPAPIDPLPAPEEKTRARSTSANQHFGASNQYLADRLEDDISRTGDTPGVSRTSSDTGVRRNLAADLAVLDRQQQDDLRSIQLRRVTQLSNDGIDREESRDLDDITSPTSSDITSRQLSVGTELPARSEASHLQSTGHNNSVGSMGSLVDTNELKAVLTKRKSSKLLGSEASQTPREEPSTTPRSAAGRRVAPGAQALVGPKQRTLMAGKWQKNFTEGTSGAKVDDLLHVSSLQRLARERIVEMQIVETDNTLELVWHIPLNGSASKISKTDRYLKNGEVVEAARRDGRPGLLRSQLTFTPEGHVHIRALQGEPYSAVFHDRIKLSTGGRRIKFEQKFQLLQPGIPPVKYFSIWHRIE